MCTVNTEMKSAFILKIRKHLLPMRAFVDKRGSFDKIFLSVDRPFRYRPYRDKENASYDD